MKLLEDNMGENLCELELGKDFLNMTPKAWSIKGVTDTFYFIQIKNFSPKDPTKRVKRNI